MGEQVLIHIDAFLPQKNHAQKRRIIFQPSIFGVQSYFQGRKNKPCIRPESWKNKKKNKLRVSPGGFVHVSGIPFRLHTNQLPTPQVFFSLVFHHVFVDSWDLETVERCPWGWIRWSSETKKNRFLGQLLLWIHVTKKVKLHFLTDSPKLSTGSWSRADPPGAGNPQPIAHLLGKNDLGKLKMTIFCSFCSSLSTSQLSYLNYL